MLNDYTCLLTLATFIGSIAIFTEYFETLKRKCDEYKGPISKIVSHGVISINYLSISLIWFVILLLFIFPNPKCHPILYRWCIKIPIIVSISILTVTLFGRWWAYQINIVLAIFTKKHMVKGAYDLLEKLDSL